MHISTKQAIKQERNACVLIKSSHMQIIKKQNNETQNLAYWQRSYSTDTAVYISKIGAMPDSTFPKRFKPE